MYTTSNKQLDFGGDPDHVDLDFLKEILPSRDRDKIYCTNFADNS